VDVQQAVQLLHLALAMMELMIQQEVANPAI